MSITYAIADLHGRFDLLLGAFSAIAANVADRQLRNDFKVITLGDYIDRGPQSRQVVDHLMAAQRAGMNLVCLRGNHEDIMVETVLKPLDPNWWFGNGGNATMRSYGQTECLRGPGMTVQRGKIPEDHLRWMSTLPLMHVDEHRVYVHAGVDPTLPLDQQREDRLTWMRYPRTYGLGHGPLHVVHGHEQYGDGPLLHAGRTDLDTFAWATGRLVIGVFDDDQPGGPIELIEVLRDPAPGYSRQSLGY